MRPERTLPSTDRSSLRLRALLVGIVAVLLAGIAGVSAAGAQAATSSVTVVHGIKGVPVDVYLDGRLALANFQPKAVAGPLNLTEGSHRVQLFTRRVNPPQAAPTSGALVDTTLTLAGGKNLSIVAHATYNASGTGFPVITVFENNLDPNGVVGSRLSVRHVADAPPVDVLLNGAVAVPGLANGSGADAPVAPGDYNVGVNLAGTTTVVLPPATLRVNASVLTNVYAIAALDGTGVELLVQTLPLRLPPPAPTASVSVVHAVLGLPVDVYLDGALAIGNFQPQAVVGGLELSPGSYRVQVFPRAVSAGAPTAPASGAVIDRTVTVTGGANVSLAAHLDAAGNPVLTAFANDISALAAGRTRISVRHAAAAGVVSVTANGATVVPSLANSAAANLEVPSFTADVAVLDGATPVPGLSATGVQFPNGVLTAVYAASSLAEPRTYALVVQTITLERGVRLITRDGGQYNLGNSTFVARTPTTAPVVAAVNTPNGDGYWTVSAQGVVTNHGAAPALGPSAPIPNLKGAIVDIATTPTGQGLYLIAADGGVFAYGDAVFRGSAGSLPLVKPVVGGAVTPSGNGYWLVASDGGVFAYGDARFYGSTGALTLNKPIVGMAAGPNGGGYWLVASDGGVFAFGNADFYGSLGSLTLNSPIVDIEPTPTGRGYRMLASDGGVFNFGNAAVPTPASAVGLIVSPAVAFA